MPVPVVKPLDIDQRRVRLAPIPLAQAQVPKWCNDNNNSEADWTYVTCLHTWRSPGASAVGRSMGLVVSYPDNVGTDTRSARLSISCTASTV